MQTVREVLDVYSSECGEGVCEMRLEREGMSRHRLMAYATVMVLRKKRHKLGLIVIIWFRSGLTRVATEGGGRINFFERLTKIFPTLQLQFLSTCSTSFFSSPLTTSN